METAKLYFSANGQTLTKTGEKNFASNTVNFIEAFFDLGDNWTGFAAVRAVWHTDFSCISTVLDSDGRCLLPHEVLKRTGKVKVNLVGSITDGEVLTDRLTTYPVVALVVDANARICGTETAEITPDQFEQFVEIVKDEVDKIKDVESVELNPDYTLTIKYSDGTEDTVGPIRGEKGETGPTGPPGPPGNGIESIELTGTSGAVKTYTITFTDGNTTTFQVTDGEVTLDELAQLLPTETASGQIASFPDGQAVIPMQSLKISLDPIQDLNGYDAPWVGGAGKNLLPPLNTKQTFAENGLTVEFDTDGTIKITGTLNSGTTYFHEFTLDASVNVDASMYFHCLNPTGDNHTTIALRTASSTTIKSVGPDTANKIIPIESSGTVSKIAVFCNQTSAMNFTMRPMICKTSTATAWQPYENICLISGHDEVGVSVVGKNLNPYEGVNYVVSNTRERFFLKAGTYTFSTDTGNQLQSGANYYIRLYDAETNGNVITSGNITSDRLALDGDGTMYYGGSGYVTVTFTLLTDAWVCFGFNNVIPTNCAAIQLEIGSSHSTYEAYNGTTTTTNFGTTVYGGNNEFVSGVLTSTMGYKTISMSQGEYHSGIGALLFYSSQNILADAKAPPNNNTAINAISDSVEVKSASAINSGSFGIGVSTTKDIYLKVSGLSSKADYVSAFPNGLVICYELATPQTYQLTPQQIETLVGQNNVWSDAGEVEVTYKADVQLYIGKLIGTTEDDYIADTAIPNGAVFSIGDRVFKATATIARGETIVPGTNCTETSITEQINSLYALV